MLAQLKSLSLRNICLVPIHQDYDCQVRHKSITSNPEQYSLAY